MERKEIILAALAAAGSATYTPVKIQKLLFLIDKRIPSLVGGPFFDFSAYDYGPFDAAIYDCLDLLAYEGSIEIVRTEGLRWNKYRLTPTGLETGTDLLSELSTPAKNFIREANSFVRKSSFAELVASIYKAYPEMKANSVFRG